MNYILFDEPILRDAFKPLSLTHPLGDLRIGIQKISEKWIPFLGPGLGFLSEAYLAPKFAPTHIPSGAITYINGGLLANDHLAKAILALDDETCLLKDNRLIAIKTASVLMYPLTAPVAELRHFDKDCTFLAHITDLYRLNGQAIRSDFEQLTQGRASQEIRDPHSIVYQADQVFLEAGVSMKACILNAENGPIYLGKNAKISEGAILIGPMAIGEGAVVNPGAKLRGDTSIGPYCKVGGEISNSLLQAFSNKGHEGFIGNSVLGEWCNLGADTNSSNLKNNYAPVRIWNYEQEDYVDSGQQFCGLIMGDHSKAGINTMFNTGSVVGVNVNVYGGGFPPKFVPSFSWGSPDGFMDYDLEKAFEVAERMMKRRNQTLTEADKSILKEINKQAQTLRKRMNS